jgi:spectrin alpha
MTAVQAREIAILETVEDIQERREQVLRRYADFKDAARVRRRRLEDARRYFQFKRDADEVEAWINEKLQIACDENYRDPTNLQVMKSGYNYSQKLIKSAMLLAVQQLSDRNTLMLSHENVARMWEFPSQYSLM